VRRTKVSELAYSRWFVGTNANIPSQIPQIAQGRTTARGVAANHGRHLLCAPHRLPMEGRSTRVYFRQHAASLLPGVGVARRLPSALEVLPAALRPPARHPMEVAKLGRLLHQGSLGRGKKPAQTRRIGANWASSGRCSPMAAAFPWAWPLTVRTDTIKNSSRPRLTAFQSVVLVPGRVVGNIFAATRASTRRSFAAKRVGGISFRTSSPAERKNSTSAFMDAAHDVGWSNASPLG
jgi:hypothetical protein